MSDQEEQTSPETSEQEGQPTAEEAFDTDTRWEDLGVADALAKALREMEYEHPTPVQVACLPMALQGKDLLVRSKTGTGKTSAFGIPIVQRIEDGAREVRALVLAPTRELAIQSCQEMGRIAKYRDLSATPVYGGVGIQPQADAMAAGTEIVVGTPGRLLDHIRRGNLKLGTCRIVCLDEADEMLSMGFLEEVTSILDHIPPGPQVLLFSATVEDQIRAIVDRYATDPQSVFLSTDTRTVEGVDHILYETVGTYPKPRQLMTIIDIEEPESGIIFCNTKDDTAMIASFLSRQGVDAEPISSDLSQANRERVMGRIKAGEIRFLVATDIASRGIDISDLTHVINYTLPEDPAVYLHRVGRTARIGKTGTAISLMSGREMNCRKILENKWEIDFIHKELPSLEDARRIWTERHVAELERAMEQVAWDGFLPIVKSIKERDDADVLFAAALRGFFSWAHMDKIRRGEVASVSAQQRREERRGGGRRGGGRRGGGGGRGRSGDRREGGRGRSRGSGGGDRRPPRDGDGGGGRDDGSKRRRRRPRRGGGGSSRQGGGDGSQGSQE